MSDATAFMDIARKEVDHELRIRALEQQLEKVIEKLTESNEPEAAR